MRDIVYGYGDGFLTQNGHRLFPIGFYEHPAEDDAHSEIWQKQALISLDVVTRMRLTAHRHTELMGVGYHWVFNPVRHPNFQEHIRTLAEHPALAVWEGPDEIVWGFTAYSGLWKQDQIGVFPNKGEWVDADTTRYRIL